MERKRDSNIELLRIVLMLMIIGGHFALHGVQYDIGENSYLISWSLGSTINKVVTCFLKPGGTIGVACFFMITGYYNIHKNSIHLKSIVLESVYYGIFTSGIGLAFWLIWGGVSKTTLLKEVIRSTVSPVMGEAWWFVSAYVFVMLLSPVINRLINAVNRRGYLEILCVFWGCGFVVSFIIGNRYVNVWKAILFYLVGGYLKRFGIHLRKATALLLFIMAWSTYVVLQYKVDTLLICGDRRSVDELFVNMSNLFINGIVVVWGASMLFILFLKIENFQSQFINFVGKTTFGVYLLHDSYFARQYIWHSLWKADTVLYDCELFPFYASIVIVATFFVCSLIDMIRIQYFEQKMSALYDKLRNMWKTVCVEKLN